jgi:fucose permease
MGSSSSSSGNSNNSSSSRSKNSSRRNLAAAWRRRSSSSSSQQQQQQHQQQKHKKDGNALLLPLPPSLQWLLTLFLALYVGAECAFGGWITTFLLQSHTTSSPSSAAFLVAIFWASITLGRALAVLQSLFLPARVSLRLQLLLSLAGALSFLFIGKSSLVAAAVSACVFGFGMSSIYPLIMTWPAEAGYGMDAGNKPFLPPSLPPSLFSCVCVCLSI